MDDRKWASLLKYASPRSILVVTWENQIMELQCPFRVLVINEVGSLDYDSIVLVERVKVSTSMIMVFIIDNEAYYYHHFHILID